MRLQKPRWLGLFQSKNNGKIVAWYVRVLKVRFFITVIPIFRSIYLSYYIVQVIIISHFSILRELEQLRSMAPREGGQVPNVLLRTRWSDCESESPSGSL